MTRALARHREGTAPVIPIIARPVEDGWQQTVFGKLKALPADGKPVTEWTNRDSAWADVTRGIRSAVKELARPKISTLSRVSSAKKRKK
jgi:hypothetical protein